MKKFTASFLLIFAAAVAFSGNIEYTYYFDSPSVKQSGDYQVIAFENTFLTGKMGEPALPYQAIKLMLPPGEEAIAVNYSFENEEIMEGDFMIYPQQPSHPYSVGSDGIFHKDDAIYASRSAYPSAAWGEYTTQFLNGHSFLLASFTPVKYIPSSGKVSYFKKITVNIETRSTDRAASALKNLNRSAKTTKQLNSFAQNREMIEAYPSKNNRDGEYQILIIAPQSFTISLQQLAELYLIRGFKTEIVAVEIISEGGEGQDLQEKIRNYIITEYQEHGIVHVLLGGDSEHVPQRGFYCHVQSSSTYEDWDIPADLYYSSLDGNWNTDGDGSWGEIGEDDLLPEVSVARFPASNVSQLQKLLHKTISYQDEPVLGEMRDVIMAGEELWTNPDTYGEDYLELLIGYQDENGYETDGIPEDYDFTKLYDSESPWSSQVLVNAINQGSSFIHHSGHANQTYVMRLGIQDITNGNFPQANGVDHNYSLIYTHGCLCGAFDMNDCIGEAMVLIDNFAVAGAFNSRYGWFNEGQTEGPSAHLHREFVDALYHDKEWQIGAAHMISKIETSVWVTAPGQWEEGALRWCFYTCNIFGDPVLGVWTEEPISIVTTYPGEISSGETTIPVTVTSDGEPVEGLMCTVMTDGEMGGCAVTDESGNAIINVPGGFEDVEFAELVISGYNCLPDHYTLNLAVGIGEQDEKNNAITIRPNPFTEKFNLTFELEEQSTVVINFYLQSGQILEELIVSGNEGVNNISVNSSKWPEGIIQARISAGGKVMKTQLLHIRK